MSALPLDPVFNDLSFVNGGMTLVSSNTIAETVQELNARFAMGKGEWFMDLQQGFPYLQAIMVKNPDVRVLAQIFRSMMLATPGVAKVVSLPISLNRSTRVLTWSAQIQHATGSYIVGGYGQPFIVATFGGGGTPS